MKIFVLIDNIFSIDLKKNFLIKFDFEVNRKPWTKYIIFNFLKKLKYRKRWDATGVCK